MLRPLTPTELTRAMKSLDDLSENVSAEWDKYKAVDNHSTANVDPGEMDVMFFYAEELDIEALSE